MFITKVYWNLGFPVETSSHLHLENQKKAVTGTLSGEERRGRAGSLKEVLLYACCRIRITTSAENAHYAVGEQ